MSDLGDAGASSGAGNTAKSKESKRGGKRSGAGRKPGTHAAYRQSIAAPDAKPLGPVDRKAAADAAFATLHLLMNNPQVDPKTRVNAAKAILDRVEGRPRQETPPVDETDWDATDYEYHDRPPEVGAQDEQPGPDPTAP